MPSFVSGRRRRWRERGKGRRGTGDGRAPCDMATTPMLRLVSLPFARASVRSIRRARGVTGAGRSAHSWTRVDARRGQVGLRAGRENLSNASAPSRPTRARASMDLDVARGSSGEGDGAIVAGSGGKPRVKPPSQVRCPNCGHWKHPRSLSCKEPGCGCSCAKHQQGIRKKRQFAQIASSDGQWDGTVQRRLVHQVTLLPDSTHRPRLPTKQQRTTNPAATLPPRRLTRVPRPARRSSSRRS